MTDTGKLVAGKKYFPKTNSVSTGNDFIKGRTWKIQKKDNKFIFEFLAARHGGGTDQHEITEHEFEAVKDGRLNFEDLLIKYDT